MKNVLSPYKYLICWNTIRYSGGVASVESQSMLLPGMHPAVIPHSGLPKHHRPLFGKDCRSHRNVTSWSLYSGAEWEHRYLTRNIRNLTVPHTYLAQNGNSGMQ